jgi:hypothetical protein
MRRMTASPSKIRLGSFSSRVRSTRAALRSLFSANCTRQSSRLLRRPNSPTVLSSLSRRSFSNGRRGFLKVLESAMEGRAGTRGRQRTALMRGCGEKISRELGRGRKPRRSTACVDRTRREQGGEALTAPVESRRRHLARCVCPFLRRTKRGRRPRTRAL